MKRLARASLNTCTSLQACAFNQWAAVADTFFLGFSDAHIIGERGGVSVLISAEQEVPNHNIVSLRNIADSST